MNPTAFSTYKHDIKKLSNQFILVYVASHIVQLLTERAISAATIEHYYYVGDVYFWFIELMGLVFVLFRAPALFSRNNYKHSLKATISLLVLYAFSSYLFLINATILFHILVDSSQVRVAYWTNSTIQAIISGVIAVILLLVFRILFRYIGYKIIPRLHFVGAPDLIESSNTANAEVEPQSPAFSFTSFKKLWNSPVLISIIVWATITIAILQCTVFFKQGNTHNYKPLIGSEILLKDNDRPPLTGGRQNCGQLEGLSPGISYGLPFIYKQSTYYFCEDWTYAESNFALILNSFIALALSASAGIISFKLISNNVPKSSV